VQHNPLYPPSSSERWLRCTASPELLKDIEQPPETEHQREGILAHKVFAAWASGADYSQPVTDEMRLFLNSCMVRLDELSGTRLVEQTVEVTYDNGSLLTNGTADIIVIDGATLHVADLKYGKGHRVQAEQNTQAMLYALGALDTLDFLFDEDIKVVVLHIWQPRLDHYPWWHITTDELEVFRHKVMDAIYEAENHPQFRPGEDTCRWCDLKASCQALAEHVQKDMFDDLDEETDMADEATYISARELSNLLDRVSLFQLWVKALHKEAEDRLLRGEAVPDYKLVIGTTHRKWTDESAVLPRLARKLGTLDKAAPRKIISVAQAEKLLTEREFKRYRGDIYKPPGKPALAKSTDKRPEFKQATDEDFNDG